MIQGTPSREYDRVDSVFIELTTHCNMHCRFCPSDCLVRPKMMMEHQTVLKILREISLIPHGVHHINFHFLGEPLLNPFLMEYLSLCDQYGYKVVLVTNLLMLDDAVMDELFSHHCLWYLYISFYAISRDAYDLRGSKMSYENYWERLKALFFSERRLASSVFTEVYIMDDTKGLNKDKLWNTFSEASFVTFLDTLDQWASELKVTHPALRRANEMSMEEIVEARCANEMSIEEITEARKKNPILYSLIHPDLGCARGIVDRSICSDYSGSEWDSYILFPNFIVDIRRLEFWNKCQNLLNQMFPVDQYKAGNRYATKKFGCDLGAIQLSVLANGEITFCCADYEGEMSIGNIDYISLVEAASSPLRALYKERADHFMACRRCRGSLIIESVDDSSESSIPHYHKEKLLKILKSGWSDLQPEGVWSEGDKSNLYLPAPPDICALHLKGGAFTHNGRPQNIYMSINGNHICHKKITNGILDIKVDFSKEILDDIVMRKTINIHFYLPDAISPICFGINSDERMIAIFLVDVKVISSVDDSSESSIPQNISTEPVHFTATK